MRTGYYLTKWRNQYWLAYVPVPFNGLGGLLAGNRPSSTALGFTNNPRGPYMRPSDGPKPHAERRYDYFVDCYSRPLNRQILSESTLYDVAWRGIPLQDLEWVDPPPHGRRLTVRIDPGRWPEFAERDRLLNGLTDITRIPRELLDAPERYFNSLVPMLRDDGWWIYDARMQGLGAQAEKNIDELELVERPWPKEMVEGITD